MRCFPLRYFFFFAAWHTFSSHRAQHCVVRLLTMAVAKATGRPWQVEMPTGAASLSTCDSVDYPFCLAARRTLSRFLPSDGSLPVGSGPSTSGRFRPSTGASERHSRQLTANSSEVIPHHSSRQAGFRSKPTLGCITRHPEKLGKHCRAESAFFPYLQVKTVREQEVESAEGAAGHREETERYILLGQGPKQGQSKSA